MDANPWRLPADRQPRRCPDPEHWARIMRQRAAIGLLDAVTAGPDFCEKALERVGHAGAA
jgi:hypothetical protein